MLLLLLLLLARSMELLLLLSRSLYLKYQDLQSNTKVHCHIQGRCVAFSRSSEVAPAVVDGDSAVGVDQAQGGQGGLGDLVLQLAAKQIKKKSFYSAWHIYLLLV